MKTLAIPAVSAMMLLAACATQPPPEPITKTVEVKVVVPVSCIPSDLPAKPAYADTDQALKAAPDFSIRYQLMASEHLHHFASEDMLWGVVEACRKIAPPPMPTGELK